MSSALSADLLAKGLDADATADVVQEVALRVLAQRPYVWGSAGLLSWAREVAQPLVAALQAEDALRVSLADLADLPGTADVPWEVSRRMALDAVLRHLAAMKDKDRDAVLAGLDYGAQASLPEARGVAVRRFRARQELATIRRRFGIVWLLGTARRVRPEGSGLAVTMTATAAAMLVSSPFVVPNGASPHEPAEPTAQYIGSAVHAVVSTRVRQPERLSAFQVRRAAPVARTRPSSSGFTPTVIDGPAGTRVQHREEEGSPDDPLWCVWGPMVGEVCTPTVQSAAASNTVDGPWP